eukprot:349801-Chlamydomonas_euryale.AAC.2
MATHARIMGTTGSSPAQFAASTAALQLPAAVAPILGFCCMRGFTCRSDCQLVEVGRGLQERCADRLMDKVEWCTACRMHGLPLMRLPIQRVQVG